MTLQYMLAPVPYSCSRSLAQRTLAYPRTKVKESGTIKRVWTTLLVVLVRSRSARCRARRRALPLPTDSGRVRQLGPGSIPPTMVDGLLRRVLSNSITISVRAA